MKILVTGGAGYIATHTDIELLNAGYEVIIVDNLSNSCREAVNRVERLTGKKVAFYEVDLLDKPALDEVFVKEKPEAVIHFAGFKAVGESCRIPLRYFDNNITGTLNLLQCMEKHRVKKLVFSSSATVYGMPDSVPIREDFPLSVLNPYGRTKLMVEDILRDIYAADSSWDIALLRYFNPIGAHESGEIGEAPNGIPNNLVPYVAKVAAGILDHVTVYGNDYATPDGTGVRDYIHVVDLAAGHVKAIEKLNSHPGILTYNLGTGRGYSVLEVIANYEKACGKKIPYVIGERRPGDAPECYADPAKAEKELGWKAVRGIEQMCVDSWHWQSKNPEGYQSAECKGKVSISSLGEISQEEVSQGEVSQGEVTNENLNLAKEEKSGEVFADEINEKGSLQLPEHPWNCEYPWYEKAVFYHIYPLGMCGAPKQNTGGVPADRLKKLVAFLPHLKRLGITGLYIGPFFESVGHGYETTDYYKVDTRLGTNEDFKYFTQQCHQMGIHVVPDGVFNHTGREFFAFQDLKEKREQSAYRDWYCNVNFGGNNEFNDGFSYEAWHGFNILPRLNLKNPAVKEYLKDAIRFWVKEFDIDGIRLDTADVLDFDFMKELRVLSRELKPEFWLLGEVIHGDYSRWVNPDMLHSVTNYELHKGLYSGHNDHNYFEIAHTVKRLFAKHGGIVQGGRLYTFVENHDVNRLSNKLQDQKHNKPIYILAYTLPGIPSLYYGGEFAVKGEKKNGSDDEIRPELHLEEFYQAGKAENIDVLASAEEVYRPEYAELAGMLEWLSRIHRTYEPLNGGEYEELLLTNRQYAFARTLESQAIIVAVNNDDNMAEVSIRLPFKGKITELNTGKVVQEENGVLRTAIEGCDGKIFFLER